MRRMFLILAIAGLAMSVLAVPVAAAAPGFRAVIHENFERRASADPCITDEEAETLTCPGSGIVHGFGQVTSSSVFTEATHACSAQPASAACIALTRILTFADGSTLVFAEEWNGFFTPGNSASAPGQGISFGNPGFDSGTWEVIGGTGVFVEATGSGTGEIVLAGDTIVLRFDGDITL